MPAIPVTFEVDGRLREMTLRPDLLAYDPAKNEAPRLHAIALARLLGQGLTPQGVPDALQEGTLTVRRKGWPDLKFDLSDQDGKTFPLEAGDHLIVEREPRINTSFISLVVPGKAFLRQFSAMAAPTLAQAIADAWSPWQEAEFTSLADDDKSLAWRAGRQAIASGDTYVSVVPRDPDFSRIRIRRQAEEGREEIIEVDWEPAIRRAGEEDATAEEIRRADVELQRGDIVEIPLREAAEGAEPWRGFSPEVIRFFDRMLAARFVWVDPQQGPTRQEYRYQPPRWVEGRHGLILLPPEQGSPTPRHWAIAGGRSSPVVRLLRDGVPTPVDHTRDWFVRDGDQMTAANVGPPRLPRVRVVAPPSSGN